jgi:hypothetical protein
MPLIAVSEESKTKLDEIAVALAKKQSVKSVTYEAVIDALLRYYHTGVTA